jgi:hypothetical protein
MEVEVKQGDLVACYVTNTSEWRVLMSWGLVLEVSALLGDIFVLDNAGYSRWWPCKRWKVVSAKKDIKHLDLDIEIV